MTKKIPLYAVILTVAFAVLITFQVTYIAFWQSFRQDELDSRPDDDFAAIEEKLKLIYDIYGENYIGQLDPEELETGVMLGLVYGTGDRYGEYMDPETYAEFTSEVAGDTEGIGIMITKSLDTGLIEIVDVIPDSPASEADLRVGDLICRVTGEEVAEVGYYAAIDMMLGKAGTTAEFTVYRDGEYIDFSIERRHVEQVNVNYRMYEDGITGIIRISSFDEVTAAQFKNAVADLQKQGAERLVFDLRNNSGGLLESVVEVLDYLLPEGVIIRINGNGIPEETISSDVSAVDMPMAVIVNQSTASAAELFTAALRDYEKSVTVGTTTYGKGSMQTVIPLSDGSALRLTYRTYSPPKSDNYDGVGITPDVEVELDEALAGKTVYSITDAEDNQLQAAIAALNK
ncbi:MAG: S41 family peptidase [Clostridia bacterium]|nr:S41 family peptidase [Clostridia bacterium]